MDIERKMDLYKAMFYCNVESERDNNFIKADSLRIELIAGGLNWKQQEFIMERLQPNAFFEVLYIFNNFNTCCLPGFFVIFLQPCLRFKH